MPLKPNEGELFFFGMAFDKFAPHKAARVLGVVAIPVDQDGRIKKCFLLEYGDGIRAHAEFVEESQGSYELLTAEEGTKKFGEDVFQ